MNFLSTCIKGVLIGAGAILPGISSGVFCVIFGIYEKLLNCILYFFKNIKSNLKFLSPLLIGGTLGVLLFSNILNYLFFAFPIQTKSIFIGLILGSIPSLLFEMRKKEDLKLSHIIYTILTFSLGIILVFFENHISINNQNNLNFFYLFFAGFSMSIGVVVPGISSTVILMLLGIYSTYITSVAHIYLPVLIPIGIGLIIGCFIFMLLIKFLLKNCYSQTFSAIIGFTLGSIMILLPEIHSLIELLISFMCIALGFFIQKFLLFSQK